MTQKERLATLAQFDMFSDDPSNIPLRSRSQTPTGRAEAIAMTEAEMVAHLTSTGRYRILQKLDPRQLSTAPRAEFPLRGIIIDTETTGLNHRQDEIIEIGIVAFTFDDHGVIGDITGIYGGLHQPSAAIPNEITKLTGITDEMVAGQIIDMAAMRSLIDPADLIIAHNAGFDRPFCAAF